MITRKQLATIIPGDIDVIVGLHKQIISKLLSGPEPDKENEEVSDACLTFVLNVFADFIPKFDAVYLDYCSRYGASAAEVMSLVKRNKEFRKFIEKAARDTRSEVESLLIKPVQRLYKYPLFFRDMRKKIPEDHRCSVLIDRVVELMGICAANVNKSIRDTEGSGKLVDIEKRLGGTLPDLLQRDRQYLDEFEAYIVKGKSNAILGGTINVSPIGAKKYTVFLFNDLLVLARPNRGNSNYLKLKARFNLQAGAIQVSDEQDHRHLEQTAANEKAARFFIFA